MVQSHGLYTMFFLFGVLPYKSTKYVLNMSEHSYTPPPSRDVLSKIREFIIQGTAAFALAGLMNVDTRSIIRDANEICPLDEQAVQHIQGEAPAHVRPFLL